MSDINPKQELVFDKIAFTYAIPEKHKSYVIRKMTDFDLMSKYDIQELDDVNKRYKITYRISLDEKNTASISLCPWEDYDDFMSVEFKPNKLTNESKVKLRNFLIAIMGAKLLNRLYYEANVTHLDLTVNIFQFYLNIYMYKAGDNVSQINITDKGCIESYIIGSGHGDWRVTLYNKTIKSTKLLFTNDKAVTLLELRLRHLGCSMHELDGHLLEHIFDLQFYSSKFHKNRDFTDNFLNSVFVYGINTALQDCTSEEQRTYLRNLAKYAIRVIDPEQLDFEAAKRKALGFLISKSYREEFMNEPA